MLFFQCKRHQEKFPEFSFDDETYLIVKLENCSDTIEITIKSYPRFPFSFVNKIIKTTSDTIVTIPLKCNMPDFYSFYINEKSRSLYLIPNDTLFVTVNFKHFDNIRSSLKLNGSSAGINEFYALKYNHFGYLNVSDISHNYINPSYTIYQTATIIDSLSNLELNFLKNNSKTFKLPPWFVMTEKNSIKYRSAALKLSQISYRNYFYKEKISDTNYYDFLDTIKINNRKAKYSLLYYEFLDSYFFQKYIEEMEGKYGLTDRVIPLRFKMMKDIRKELTVDSKDLFLAYIISPLYYHIQNDIIKYGSNPELCFYLIDSLIRSQEDQFTDKMLYQYIISGWDNKKDSVIAYLKDMILLKEGDKAPDFYLSDTNGKYFSLKDFKGRLVYLNFWAEYCNPCLSSIPDKNKLIKQFEDKPIVFVNIYLSSTEKKWKKIIKEKKLSGINLICKGNWYKILKKEYNIYGIPFYVLIDKEGKIIKNKNEGPETVSNKLKKLLEKH